MALWGRVAWCETHARWDFHGPLYSGALGIRNDVWAAYGGNVWARDAGGATPAEQVYIAVQINGTFVPDQGGCVGW